jgi:hypothetical protein
MSNVRASGRAWSSGTLIFPQRRRARSASDRSAKPGRPVQLAATTGVRSNSTAARAGAGETWPKAKAIAAKHAGKPFFMVFTLNQRVTARRLF